MKKSYRKIPGEPLNKEIFNIRLHPDKMMQKQTSVRNVAQEVPNSEGTIEAEKGETIVGNMNHDGMPMFQKIGGKSHAKGGTVLNAPDNAYVFSKFNKMKIKNPYILQSFGLDPYTAITPAQISNRYDFSDSVRGLFDPMSDKLQQKTYEMNIRNSVNKLGKLALVQEGMKGFPQGIPKISEPYLVNTGMQPDLFIGNEPGDFNDQGMPMAKFGGQLSRRSSNKRKVKIIKAPISPYRHGGQHAMYQTTGPVDSITIADSLMKKQLPSKQPAPKKPVVTKYNSEAEYQAHLLDPYSPEKIQAQRDWIMAHPKKVQQAPPPVTSKGNIGFSEIEEAEGLSKNFIQKYPSEYALFLKAFNSNEEDELEKAATHLEKYDVKARLDSPSTWFPAMGWIPDTEQDKFEDLAGILKERKDMLKAKTDDEKISNDIYGLIKKLKEAKVAATADQNYMLSSQIDSQLNDLERITPEYKNAGWRWYQYEDKRIPVVSPIVETLFNYVSPDKMYNKDEENLVKKYSEKFDTEIFPTTKLISDKLAKQSSTETKPEEKSNVKAVVAKDTVEAEEPDFDNMTAEQIEKWIKENE